MFGSENSAYSHGQVEGTEQRVANYVNQFREKVVSSDGSVKIDQHFGVDGWDASMVFKPDDGSVVVSVRPDDFEERTAENASEMIANELGRSPTTLTGPEGTAFAEFSMEIQWSPAELQ